MSEPKFVPGPWRLEEVRPGDKWLLIHGYTLYAKPNPFAYIDYDDCDHEEALATALLVEAAPELYEELEKSTLAMAAVLALFIEGLSEPMYEELGARVLASSALLAKARGEEFGG
jgi:hypothetical protein